MLDVDMAAIFPTSKAVNEALRVLASAAQNLPGVNAKRERRLRRPARILGTQE